MRILKPAIRQFLTRAAVALWFTGCVLIGFRSIPVDGRTGAEDCMGEVSRRVRQAPEKEHLYTLDGQTIRLADFFSRCEENAPDCILFAKFYHWKNEVKKIVSMMDNGPVEHRIRAYYSPLSVCQPQKIHPGRTHGDVAEFYDAGGRFMGLAVYMGQGKYYLLYYSGYKNSSILP